MEPRQRVEFHECRTAATVAANVHAARIAAFQDPVARQGQVLHLPAKRPVRQRLVLDQFLAPLLGLVGINGRPRFRPDGNLDRAENAGLGARAQDAHRKLAPGQKLLDQHRLCKPPQQVLADSR